MKIIFSLFLAILFTINSSAQSEPTYYRIKFIDKANSAFSLSRPSEFLSAQSIERRHKQQIALTESDLPVNHEYLEVLRKDGAEILYSSKWLNLVIVKIADRNDIGKIASNQFIKEINPADHLFKQNLSQKKNNFFDFETVEEYKTKEKILENKTVSAYNYGASLNQAQMIGVDQMHDLGFNGRGVKIAVIDGGFNSVNTLAVFDSLNQNGQIIGTKDFVQPGNDVYGTLMSTHGMMVLSIMGGYLPGQLIGTAPKASYLLLRSEDVQAEYLMEEYYWVNAAEYADSVGVDIINSSLGYTLFDNGIGDHSYADMDGNTTVVTIGADMAASKGILVVNSAGNSGNDPWHYIGAPADGDSVFSIGAVDPSGVYASFSSVGPTSDGRIKPDVSAQGANTIVAVIPSGVAAGSGTSFSSPVIAGAAACLWQANPTFSNMELVNAIRNSGSQSSSPDNLKGWGIPDFILANNLLTSTFIEIKETLTGLNAYPIPFHTKITIELESSLGIIADIKILSSMGSTMAEMKGIEINKGKNLISFNKLDRLPKGIYMLQISDGYHFITKKIVK
ncbi:MAG: S8 family serine peptidase [Lentimicrobium sp.]|nr:S8 family serine peptidase [Lentimicrobium sp.]